MPDRLILKRKLWLPAIPVHHIVRICDIISRESTVVGTNPYFGTVPPVDGEDGVEVGPVLVTEDGGDPPVEPVPSETVTTDFHQPRLER